MADRIYNLFNFRDLGGYRLKNGGTTQCGAIARSNILLHASEEDIARLKQLGFTTIVDLRTDMETAFSIGANHVAIYPFIDFTFTKSPLTAMPKKENSVQCRPKRFSVRMIARLSVTA